MGYSQWDRKYHLPYIAAGKIKGDTVRSVIESLDFRKA